MKDESTSILYTELVRLNRDIFVKAIKEGGIDVMETITAKDAMSIQSLQRLPTNKIRNLRICLSNLCMNILLSERKMRKAKEPIVSHINENAVETGFIGLKQIKNDKHVTACPFYV